MGIDPEIAGAADRLRTECALARALGDMFHAGLLAFARLPTGSWPAAFLKFMDAEFDRLDTNKDGELDANELKRLRVVNVGK